MNNLLPLETERLIIKPFQKSDYKDFLSIHQNPEIMKYFISGVKDDNHAKEVFDSILLHQDYYGFSYWAIFLKQGDNEIFIGQGGVVKNTEVHNICFAFLQDYWGKGYGYEAITSIINWFFEYTHLKKISAITMPENLVSKKLLSKAGLKYLKDKKLPKSKIIASHFELTLKEYLKKKKFQNS